MKRRLAIICFFLTLLPSTWTHAAPNSGESENKFWPQGPSIFSESAIVMEASTGLILYEKNIHKVQYPASITKIMAALLALENASLGEVVTFSRSAIFDVDLRSSRIGIDVGEELTMQQCIYSIMLASANEVTHGVAEHIAGSVPAFSDMMNDRARELGALNTNFVNPHGLPDDNHVTTAYDMALITREAIKNETFRKVFGTRTYQIPPTNIQSETRYMRNNHRFVLRQTHIYDDAIGGKTGFTNKARYTLATVAKRGDLELIAIVMKADTFDNQYHDTKKILDFAFNNFSIYPIAELEQSISNEESPMFTRFNPLLNKAESPLITDNNGYLVLPKSASFEDAKKEITFFQDTHLQDGNNVIGNITFTYNNKYVGGANILYQYDERPSLSHVISESNDRVIIETDNTPIKVDESPSSLRYIILSSIIGILVLLFCLYYMYIELPRIRRRNAYYKKRRNRRVNDYLDL